MTSELMLSCRPFAPISFSYFDKSPPLLTTHDTINSGLDSRLSGSPSATSTSSLLRSDAPPVPAPAPAPLPAATTSSQRVAPPPLAEFDLPLGQPQNEGFLDPLWWHTIRSEQLTGFKLVQAHMEWDDYLDFSLAPLDAPPYVYHGTVSANSRPSSSDLRSDDGHKSRRKRSSIDSTAEDSASPSGSPDVPPSRSSTDDEGSPSIAHATPFISKLYYLLNQPEYAEYLRWSPDGLSIVIAQTRPELLDILSKFFRHSTCASFIRQLNIYHFKRLSTTRLLAAIDPQLSPHFTASDFCAFAHVDFFRPSPEKGVCPLGKLKPPIKEKPSVHGQTSSRRRRRAGAQMGVVTEGVPTGSGRP